MGAKNKVIAGDYANKVVTTALGQVSIANGFKYIPINKNTIEQYEIMDEEQRKSASSAVGRGLVGGIVLGPVGMLAALSARRKGVFIVSLEFKDGKKSLIEVNEKIYKNLIKVMY